MRAEGTRTSGPEHTAGWPSRAGVGAAGRLDRGVPANGSPRARHTRNSPGSTLAGRGPPDEAGGNRFPRKGAETMIALAARGICKSFGRRQVLTGLDLEVAAGEMVAVVGENGTGKTTLLRILAGDLSPDTGSVTIGGRPGYCPQTVVLDEALTVDQHVRYFQAAYGLGGTGRAGELIERLGYASCRGQRA